MPEEYNNEQTAADTHHDPVKTEPTESAGADTQADNDIGALIISGLGKDTRWPVQFYLILLASAILPIGTGYFLATQFGYRLIVVFDVLGSGTLVRTVFYYIYICAGVVLAVAVVFVQILTREQLAKTRIFVYENGIEGVGLGTGLGPRILSGAALQPFRLPYSQITLVSVWQRAATPGIWVDAGGQAFSVYPPNTTEILAAINENKAHFRHG